PSRADRTIVLTSIRASSRKQPGTWVLHSPDSPSSVVCYLRPRPRGAKRRVVHKILWTFRRGPQAVAAMRNDSERKLDVAGMRGSVRVLLRPDRLVDGVVTETTLPAI